MSSAAEKLKALKPFSLTVKPTAYAGPETSVELYDVPLPQIVALVEWTERYADSGDWHAYSGTDGERMDTEMDALLAALDEALGEEKDESWRSGLWRQRS